MKIVYVGPFAYPSSKAESLRVQGVIGALLASGHEVVVGSAETAVSSVAQESVGGAAIFRLGEYEQGIGAGVSPGVRGMFLGDRTLKWIAQMDQQPDAIILYGVHLGYLLRLSNYCRSAGITFIVDVVEWYRARDLPGGRFGPFALSNELSMRLFSKRADGVFAISSLLEDHYIASGCDVLRVPPMLDAQNGECVDIVRQGGSLNICYVGSPGTKEALPELFAGFRMARDAGARVTLHFVGALLRELAGVLPIDQLRYLDSENCGVVFHGRVSNDQAVKLVKTSDFSVVIRHREKFVDAGFPFKVAESLVNGIPLVCNFFSDIDQYICDGREAIIVPCVTAHSLAQALVRADRLDDASIHKMKIAARSTGESFMPIAHAQRLDRFLSRLVTKRHALDKEVE